MGLKINASKSKVMQTADMPQANLKVDGVPIKQVRSFVYLDQKVNMRYDLLLELKSAELLAGSNFTASLTC